MKIQHKHNTRNTRNTRKTHKNRKTRKYLRKNKTNRRKRGGDPLSRAARRSQTNSRSTLRGKTIKCSTQSPIPAHLRSLLINGVEQCRRDGRQIMASRV